MDAIVSAPADHELIAQIQLETKHISDLPPGPLRDLVWELWLLTDALSAFDHFRRLDETFASRPPGGSPEALATVAEFCREGTAPTDVDRLLGWVSTLQSAAPRVREAVMGLAQTLRGLPLTPDQVVRWEARFLTDTEEEFGDLCRASAAGEEMRTLREDAQILRALSGADASLVLPARTIVFGLRGLPDGELRAFGRALGRTGTSAAGRLFQAFYRPLGAPRRQAELARLERSVALQFLPRGRRDVNRSRQEVCRDLIDFLLMAERRATACGRSSSDFPSSIVPCIGTTPSFAGMLRDLFLRPEPRDLALGLRALNRGLAPSEAQYLNRESYGVLDQATLLRLCGVTLNRRYSPCLADFVGDMLMARLQLGPDKRWLSFAAEFVVILFRVPGHRSHDEARAADLMVRHLPEFVRRLHDATQREGRTDFLHVLCAHLNQRPSLEARLVPILAAGQTEVHPGERQSARRHAADDLANYLHAEHSQDGGVAEFAARMTCTKSWRSGDLHRRVSGGKLQPWKVLVAEWCSKERRLEDWKALRQAANHWTWERFVELVADHVQTHDTPAKQFMLESAPPRWRETAVRRWAVNGTLEAVYSIAGVDPFLYKGLCAALAVSWPEVEAARHPVLRRRLRASEDLLFRSLPKIFGQKSLRDLIITDPELSAMLLLRLRRVIDINDLVPCLDGLLAPSVGRFSPVYAAIKDIVRQLATNPRCRPLLPRIASANPVALVSVLRISAGGAPLLEDLIDHTDALSFITRFRWLACDVLVDRRLFRSLVASVGQGRPACGHAVGTWDGLAPFLETGLENLCEYSCAFSARPKKAYAYSPMKALAKAHRQARFATKAMLRQEVSAVSNALAKVLKLKAVREDVITDHPNFADIARNIYYNGSCFDTLKALVAARMKKRWHRRISDLVAIFSDPVIATDQRLKIAIDALAGPSRLCRSAFASPDVRRLLLTEDACVESRRFLERLSRRRARRLVDTAIREVIERADAPELLLQLLLSPALQRRAGRAVARNLDVCTAMLKPRYPRPAAQIEETYQPSSQQETR